MKQVITIQGTPIETYDDSVIQLDYKSNILGEIDKIETCHSYTYAIPSHDIKCPNATTPILSFAACNVIFPVTRSFIHKEKTLRILSE